ncbi:MAG: FAD-dependent oxidoreductase, partial [Mycobacterium sp.]|nr:FAD-dependent oxidoreductase [Mycobacterium sp.]
EVGRRAHLPLPSFWSAQFGVNIKSVGVCSFGDEIVFTQGSPGDRRFAAAYGRNGRIVGAVTFNHGKWLPYYARLIERSAPFPPPPPSHDQPVDHEVMPARFPDPRERGGDADVVLTGHDPTDRTAEFRPRSQSHSR